MNATTQFQRLLGQVRNETVRLTHPDSIPDYTEYEDFVELRQRLVDLLEENPDIAQQERDAINQLAPFEEELVARMEALKREALFGLRRLEESRKQRDAYSDDYGTVEGFMFDKRR